MIGQQSREHSRKTGIGCMITRWSIEKESIRDIRLDLALSKETLAHFFCVLRDAHLLVLLLISYMRQYGLLGLQPVEEGWDRSSRAAGEHLRIRSVVLAIHGLLLLWTRRVALKTFARITPQLQRITICGRGPPCLACTDLLES